MAKTRSTISGGRKSTAKQQLAVLRKRGLTSAKPKGRPGGSAYAILRKLRPVLEGKAQPIKLSKDAKKKYAGLFPIAHGKAIVPIHKGERVTISVKTQTLHRVKRIGRRRFKFDIVTKQVVGKNLTGDEDTVYRFHLVNGRTEMRIGRTAAEAFITQYDVSTFVEDMDILTEEMFDEE